MMNDRTGIKHGIAYAALLLFGVGVFVAIQYLGRGLEAPVVAGMQQVEVGDPIAGIGGDGENRPPVPLMFHILLTLTVVVAAGNVLGRLCRYIGQPPVIGEVLAGIALGPSLLGAISPESLQLLIPSSDSDPGGSVSAALKAIAGLGVVLYMFIVGLELDGAALRHRAGSAVAISHSSIVIPFVLGAILSLGLYTRVSSSDVSFTSFSLFCGVAMSITAFPVLARILTDRKIQKTKLGMLALGCAAADDVTAWCLLAVVVGIVQSNLSTAAYVLAGSLGFVAMMLLVVRPILRKWVIAHEGSAKALSSGDIAILIGAALMAACATEAIGIHALFGAFLFGSLIPTESRMAKDFMHRVKEPVQILLLPAFFAYTGMRMEIGLVDSPEHWMWCLIIVLVATAGKFGGTLFAARLSGESWRDSAALGALMNTRGLMELIVLNIGLDLGVISPLLFTMMVIMAIVTTMTTAPVLSWLTPKEGWR